MQLKNIIGVGKKFCLIPFLFRKGEQNKLIDGVPTNITVGMPFFVMGRDPVELAKRAKHKPPAMQVRDECYTKNHLSLIM